MEELQPETSIEYSLIETMAAARWRQLRIGMETAGMNYQIRNDSRSLDLINRNDSRYERQYLRPIAGYSKSGTGVARRPRH